MKNRKTNVKPKILYLPKKQLAIKEIMPDGIKIKKKRKGGNEKNDLQQNQHDMCQIVIA